MHKSRRKTLPQFDNLSWSRKHNTKTEKIEDNQEDYLNSSFIKMASSITEQSWRTKLIIDIE